MLHQPGAIRGRDLREQHQPIAIGEQPQQLGDDRRRRAGALRAAASTMPRFCAGGIAGIRQHTTEGLVAGDDPRELGEIAACLLNVRIPSARRRTARARSERLPHGSSSRLLQLRRVAIDEPQLIVGRDRPPNPGFRHVDRELRRVLGQLASRDAQPHLDLAPRLLAAADRAPWPPPAAIRACSAATSCAPCCLRASSSAGSVFSFRSICRELRGRRLRASRRR